MYDADNLPVSLPAICAPRDDLMSIFNSAAEKQFVYIQAPGGYGKTVTAMLWLKKTGFKIAWCSLDEYVNTPAMFYRAFCLALLTAVPQEKEISAIPRSSAFSGDPAEFTIEFLMRADFGRQRVVLVMDDFHTVTNQAVLKSFSHVLKRLPRNITVLLLSRNEALAHLGALKDSGLISVIGERELAFSAEEIQQYAAFYRYFLTEKQAEEIRVYTDGWITLLNMIITGHKYDGDIGRLKVTVGSYYEERWNRSDESLKNLALIMSVPDHFTLELCKTMTGNENCEELLNMLIVGNANLSCAEGKYRFHQIFLEFLREKLTESDIDITAAYITVTEYYYGKSDFAAAYKYAIKSGNPDMINKVLVKLSLLEDISWDEVYGVIDIDEITDDICDKSPLLYFTRMFLYLTGNRDGFDKCMDKIYGKLPVLAAEHPQVYGVFLTCCMIDYRVSFYDLVKRVPLIEGIQVEEGYPGGLQMPFLHRDFRDYYELTDAGLRMKVEAFFRNLFKNKQKYECGQKNLFSCVEAGLCMEQNRLPEAFNTLLRAERRINDETIAAIGWAVYIMLAETSLYMNDAESYEMYKAKAKAYFENRGAFCFQKNFLAYETRVKLLNGDTDDASQWLDSYFVGQSEFGYLYKIYQNFTTVRAYIVLGRTGEALTALEEIRAASKTFNRPLDAAEADVLTVLTEWGMGNKKEARERLQRLLTALYPRRFIRVIANEGKSVLPVLQSILKNLDKEVQEDEAFRRYVREVYNTACEWAKRFKGLTHGWARKPIKLSPKQGLILSLLSKGHKNAQIVDMTGLSINTIKSYTKIAYQKLDVNNASDAIVKAKSLGILK